MEHLNRRLRRLLQILLGVLDSPSPPASLLPGEFVALLSGAGYGEQDLQDLWRWLRGRWEPTAEGPAWLSSRLAAKAHSQSLRSLGMREDDLLTVPAFGYLLELVRSRQISAEQMEALIQLSQLVPGGPLSAQDIAQMLEQVMLGHYGRQRALPPWQSDRAQ